MFRDLQKIDSFEPFVVGKMINTHTHVCLSIRPYILATFRKLTKSYISFGHDVVM